uniref:Uncharacterized protein n=1 Tax=Opuntia streptacantha TaxID=393608 RepID=A0A7C9AH39_OPUST
MDLRPLDQNQPPIKVPEENKQKKEGGNRRPLQEISNLVDFHPAPIIKNLGALSLANDQREAEKNKDKNQEELKGQPQGRDGKKVTYKPEPEKVIVISSDDEEEKEVKREVFNQKKKILSGNRSNRKKKKIHSLTSVLTARSKVACGLASKPRDQIVNIDAADADNELAVVEYIEEIYNFYKLTEEEYPLFDYMPCQSHINKAMRMILVDWLVEVHTKFELLPETFYLTINLVDRYLSRKIVSRRELQLVGISSMLLACKYEEIWAPEVNDFICICANAYTKEQVLAMEKAILEKLEWNLTVATPYVFLVRFIKATVPSDKKLENMAFYLAENGLMHYQIIVSFCPSLIAAASVYVAMHTLNSGLVWTETLKHYTGYAEEQLRECARMLVSVQLASKDSKLKAVYRKFSSADWDAVACLPPAKHLNCQ